MEKVFISVLKDFFALCYCYCLCTVSGRAVELLTDCITCANEMNKMSDDFVSSAEYVSVAVYVTVNDILIVGCFRPLLYAEPGKLDTISYCLLCLPVHRRAEIQVSGMSFVAV